MGSKIRRQFRYFAIGFTNAFDMTGKRLDANIEVDARPFGYYANRKDVSTARKKITSKARKSVSSSS